MSVMLKVRLNHFSSSTNITAWCVHILSALAISQNGINFPILNVYFTVLSKLFTDGPKKHSLRYDGDCGKLGEERNLVILGL